MAEWGDFELTIQKHHEKVALKLLEAYRELYDFGYDLPETLEGRFRDPHIPVKLINALRAFGIDFEIYVSQEYEYSEELLCHIKCEYDKNGKETVLIDKQETYQDEKLILFTNYDKQY